MANRCKTLYELREDIKFLKEKKESDPANWECGEESILYSYSKEYSMRTSRGEVVVVPPTEVEVFVDFGVEEPIIDFSVDDSGD